MQYMPQVTETFLPPAAVERIQILLPLGLIGLGDLRHFDLEPLDESWPLLRLCSRGPMELEFLAVEAKHVVADYVVELSDEDARELDLAAPDDAMILNLVTVHSHRPQYVSVNLAGPIIVNRHTLRGRQVVQSPCEKYPTVHPLIDERVKAPRVSKF
jgi:flagellar assembly factor FliW